MDEPNSQLSDNLSEKASKYFYYENGLMVFTEAYHLLRGYCCHRGCRHCPFGDPLDPGGKSKGGKD